MALVVKNPPANAGDTRHSGSSHWPGRMAPHSSILAWKTSYIEEPCQLQSLESQRAMHDWITEHTIIFIAFWKGSIVLIYKGKLFLNYLFEKKSDFLQWNDQFGLTARVPFILIRHQSLRDESSSPYLYVAYWNSFSLFNNVSYYFFLHLK